MSSRPAQALLAVIALLLVAHLAFPHGLLTPVSAQASAAVPDVLRARRIDLVNASGAVVGQLYTGEDGGGQIRLRSPDGEVRVKLGASADGSGLILMDDKTEPALWLASKREGTSLTLAQRGREKRVFTP